MQSTSCFKENCLTAAVVVNLSGENVGFLRLQKKLSCLFFSHFNPQVEIKEQLFQNIC